MSDHWCVVGGGMLGLTLARRLSQAGRRVTVLEASERLGGLADSWHVGPITWDRHYHVTLLSDFHLRGLLKELGLEDALCWGTTKTDFYTQGMFHPLNNAFDYLRFPPLNLFQKMRLAGTISYAARLENGKRLERIPLERWLRGLSGNAVYEKIWLPLLRAKLGPNHTHASASFIWAVIQRLYAARRSGLKTEMFGYIDGGYGRVLERFAHVLDTDGVDVRPGVQVKGVRQSADGMTVETAEESLNFDHVVVTAPSGIAAEICEGLSEAERAAHRGITYQGIICPSVVLKRPLRGAYITYITDPDIPYTAVIEMSALVDRSQFGGHSLVYLPLYVPSDDPLFEASDDEIEAKVLNALSRMYPDLTPEDVIAVRTSRVRRVLALSTLNYSDRLPPIKTSVPGLHIANSAHIVNGTLNVNETVGLANEIAEKITGRAAPQWAGEAQ